MTDVLRVLGDSCIISASWNGTKNGSPTHQERVQLIDCLEGFQDVVSVKDGNKQGDIITISCPVVANGLLNCMLQSLRTIRSIQVFDLGS